MNPQPYPVEAPKPANYKWSHNDGAPIRKNHGVVENELKKILQARDEFNRIKGKNQKLTTKTKKLRRATRNWIAAKMLEAKAQELQANLEKRS